MLFTKDVSSAVIEFIKVSCANAVLEELTPDVVMAKEIEPKADEVDSAVTHLNRLDAISTMERILPEAERILTQKGLLEQIEGEFVDESCRDDFEMFCRYLVMAWDARIQSLQKGRADVTIPV